MSLEELDKRQNNMVISVRCDRRTLATLHNFYIDQGESIFTIGSLVNITLENFRHLILNQNRSYDVSSTHDATEILNRFSRARLNPGGRFEKTYMKQIQMEGNVVSKYELGNEGTRSKTIEEKKMEDLRKEAERLAPEIARKAREAEDRKQAQDMKTGLSQVPSNVVKKDEE